LTILSSLASWPPDGWQPLSATHGVSSLAKGLHLSRGLRTQPLPATLRPGSYRRGTNESHYPLRAETKTGATSRRHHVRKIRFLTDPMQQSGAHACVHVRCCHYGAYVAPRLTVDPDMIFIPKVHCFLFVSDASRGLARVFVLRRTRRSDNGSHPRWCRCRSSDRNLAVPRPTGKTNCSPTHGNGIAAPQRCRNPVRHVRYA